MWGGEDDDYGHKKEGRERQLEQKRERAARIHGAAQDREAMAYGAGWELDDATLYGASHGAFQSALSREKEIKARRDRQRQERLAELQQKERDKQEEMWKKLGWNLPPGPNRKIPPRKDG